MKVGFTGTREGITVEQNRSLIAWAKTTGATEFHHGCCIGADSEAWDVFASGADLGFRSPKTVAHPPRLRGSICESTLHLSDEVRAAADYLARNRNIVDACEVLAACPKGPEERRSGTWSTVRYARKQGKRVVIFWPDGEVTEEK
jgi:hypothetical protein